jgi:Cft2 family RNA processing exonuclease
MSLKKKFEGFSTSPKWRNDSYKKSIRSLKPKQIRKLEGEDDQDTQFFSTLIGKGANFREVDSYAQQKRYHEYDIPSASG